MCSGLVLMIIYLDGLEPLTLNLGTNQKLESRKDPPRTQRVRCSTLIRLNLSKMFFPCPQPAGIAYMTSVAPPALTGTAISLMATVTWVIGKAVKYYDVFNADNLNDNDDEDDNHDYRDDNDDQIR